MLRIQNCHIFFLSGLITILVFILLCKVYYEPLPPITLYAPLYVGLSFFATG